MSKRTLLDLTQGILSEMDSDEVNHISDTIEATSVANLIRQVYYDIVDEQDLPSNRQLVALEGLGDVTKPNIMKIPDNVGQIDFIKYDNRTSIGGDVAYQKIVYKSVEDFINLSDGRSSSDTDISQVVNIDSNTKIIIGKVAGPNFWTSFDDEYIVFDSYDSTVESTLQSSKSLCYASVRPTFTVADDFDPDLPENLFNMLYTMSLARAFANQRQTLNPKAERQENRVRIRGQRNKWREARMINTGPDYGRRR